MFSINGEILLKEAKVDGIKKALKYWESKGHLADYEQGWKQEERQETAAQLLQFLKSGHSIEEAEKKFLVTS
ncbi:MAG: hypothetical protein LBC70_02420, partial [Chitinispirillales bacterium]|jgi:hypothetical protein|nr:hypothetical protein [Chitinispirillales bacterium]